MKKDLYAYVRVDSTGRIVPGSLILRSKRLKPVSSGGRFIEVTTYQCCAPVIPPTPQTIALPTLTGGAPNYHIEFENGILTSGDVDTGTTTGATLVTYLTTNYSAQGTFVLDGTNILFTPAVAGTTLSITAGA